MLLLEEFEGIHQGLFAVSVSFLVSCTFLVVAISKQYQRWGREYQAQLLDLVVRDALADDKKVTPLTSQICALQSLTRSTRSVGTVRRSQRPWMSFPFRKRIWARRVTLCSSYSKATRCALLNFSGFASASWLHLGRSSRVPENFKFGRYLEGHSSNELRELVKVEPYQLSWVILFFFLDIEASEIFSNWDLKESTAIAFGASHVPIASILIAPQRNQPRPSQSFLPPKTKEQTLSPD